ncbi:hypothetical protein AB0J38_11680 [Streptomyces sp. NPDC050095]|uniref:hypothetical protein n=1 Tax=unclassified Streptomyces TaxID=2593676 RepID=UPI00341F4822
MISRRMFVFAGIALAVVVGAAPVSAQSPAPQARVAPAASGSGKDGPVSIGVIGTKLKVKEVRAVLDGWDAGAKARVSLWQHGSYVRQVRGWKYTRSEQAYDYKYEITSWNLHNKTFPNHSQLCVEFAGYDRLACATIHS